MNSIGHFITSTCIDKIAEKQSFLFFMTSTIQAPINPKHQFVLKKERETVNVHVIFSQHDANRKIKLTS
jgi:hypothetical protein